MTQDEIKWRLGTTQKEILWRPEEIVEMCKQAGFFDGMASVMGLWGLHEFARIAVEKEREACAQLCEAEAVDLTEGEWDGCCLTLAKTIRNRGQKWSFK